ncbi:hypothetical protein BIV57_10385 [Mangrovactinospora gilvigrisea]|uniref:Beta-lactamase-related domain-containing protein n=1 Tax=Mangrovactinospora gilvigrisea TaxID=1428644 RepID=A0A1J7BG22_9ACTN|nr:serine hydrolase domain-containing protein [Mangrovactinospora gilvigrisea]OIV37525.1 hypothetical protein BIV57_10385 [Mangrovactinospora gilvigrisea]
MSAGTVDSAGAADAVEPAGDPLELVRARGGAAQLCVLHRGRPVLDEAVNCRPDDLFWTFSASKPLVALVVHQLAERGELGPDGLDTPVAAHWPEFAARGKEGITVRHVLRHRAGVPVSRGALGDALRMTDWPRAVRAVEEAEPIHPPGEGPAYHFLNFGTILGELVRRVTGEPVDVRMRATLLDPLGLDDLHLGLPRALRPRAVPIRVELPGRRWAARRAAQLWLNRGRLRGAVVPGAGVSANARDLARLYQALLDGGAGPDGTRVLEPATVAEARRPSTEGERDRFLGFPVRWAQGFQLGGPTDDPRHPRAMGALSSALTFGHNGSNCCIAWADPTRELVFVHLTNRLPGSPGRLHQIAVADAVLAGYPPREKAS